MIILNVYYTLTLVLQLRKPGDTFIPHQPRGDLGHELSHILSPCEQHPSTQQQRMIVILTMPRII